MPPLQPTWRNRPEVALLALYAILHAVLGWRLGIQSLTDTPRYLHLAQHLWTPSQWAGGDIWYWGYAALLRLTGAPDHLCGIVLLQWLAGAACLWTLIRTARAWAGPLAGWTTGLLYLAYVDHQAFHWKLLTDSLFTSLTGIVLLSIAHKQTTHGWVASLPLVLLRPVGWVVVACVGWMQMAQLPPRRRWPLLLLISILGVGLALIVFRDYAIAEGWASGAVIQGYAGVMVTPPTGLSPEPGLLGWLRVVVQAPVYSFELAGQRLFWFLVGIRPYYSLSHNLYLGAWLLAVYLLAGIGFRHLAAQPRTLFLVFLALLSAAVVAAAPDWDGRFFHPLVPPLCLLAGIGAQHLTARCH